MVARRPHSGSRSWTTTWIIRALAYLWGQEMLSGTPGQVRQWEGRFCRLGQKRPVVIYYVVAENSVDEHVADKLIAKLPGVEKIAQDTELAEAKYAIGGMEDEDALVDSILSKLED